MRADISCCFGRLLGSRQRQDSLRLTELNSIGSACTTQGPSTSRAGARSGQDDMGMWPVTIPIFAAPCRCE